MYKPSLSLLQKSEEKMEAFVTRKELDEALKELKKLRLFLSDTFGAKFEDFMKKDEDPYPNPVPEKKELETCPNQPSKPQTIRVEIVRSETPPPPHIQDEPEPDPLQVPPALSPSPLPPQPTVIDLTENVPSSSTETTDEMTAKGSNPEKRVATVRQFETIRRHREPSFISRRSMKIKSTKWLTPREAASIVVPVKLANCVIPPRPTKSKPLDSFKKKRSLRLDDKDSNPKQQKTGPTTTTTSASTSNSSGENEIIQCDDCQLFIFASQIESHKRNHALYDARKVEKTSSLLRQQYKCPVCQENCENFDEYEEHLNEAHPNLKGRPCPICSKVLSVKTRLRRHLLLHDQLKFCCNICGKAYNRSDNLSAHYKTHEKNKTVEYFYCSVCNNAFASREGRDRHLASSHQGSPNPKVSNPNPAPEPAPQQARGNKNLEESLKANETASANDAGPICLVAAETEKIKIDCDNLSDFEYEGDDD